MDFVKSEIDTWPRQFREKQNVPETFPNLAANRGQNIYLIISLMH